MDAEAAKRPTNNPFHEPPIDNEDDLTEPKEQLSADVDPHADFLVKVLDQAYELYTNEIYSNTEHTREDVLAFLRYIEDAVLYWARKGFTGDVVYFRGLAADIIENSGASKSDASKWVMGLITKTQDITRRARGKAKEKQSQRIHQGTYAGQFQPEESGI